MADATKRGSVAASVETITASGCIDCNAGQRNRADVFVVNWVMLRLMWLVPHAQNRLQKGGWQKLKEIIATGLLIVLAWFAAGSSQLADERSQIKRGNKWARDNYPPTY